MLTFQIILLWAATPQATIINPPADQTITTLQQMFFSAFSSDPDSESYTYHWSLSSGETFQGNNITFQPAQAGPLLLSMTAKDAQGNESVPDTRYIYVMEIFEFLFLPEVGNIHTSMRNVHPGAVFTARADIESIVDPPATFLWFWHDGTRAYRAEGEEVQVSFPNPATMSTSYSLQVIARDSAGRYSLEKKISIFVDDENLPPEGVILAPERFTSVPPGTVVSFRGGATDFEGDTPISYRWVTPAGTLTQGASFEHRFNETGYFTTTLTATDALGNSDPNPPAVYITVEEQTIPDLQATIQFPALNTVMSTGESMFFSGFAFDIPGYSRVDSSWTIQKVTGSPSQQVFEGERVPRVTFDQQGLYYVTYTANKQGVTSDRTRHNARWLGVRDRSRQESNPLRFLPVGPDVLPNGSSLELEVDLSNQTDPNLRFYWMISGQNLGELGSKHTYHIQLPDEVFQESGNQGIFNLQVSVVAVDANQRVVSQPVNAYFNIYNGVTPATITLDGYEITETIFFPIGTQFHPVATVENPANLNMVYSWRLQGIGLTSSEERPGLDPGIFSLDEPGLFTLDLRAVTADESLMAGRTVFNYIHVFDPALTPRTTITQPSESNISVDQSASFKFEGFTSDPAFVEVPFPTILNQPVTNSSSWVHTLPDGREERYQSPSLIVAFEEIGTHQIRLETLNSLGQNAISPDSRTVFVSASGGIDRFEPNNSMEQASLILPGELEGLTLDTNDPVDWYVLDIRGEGTTLQFRLDLTQANQAILLQVSTVEKGVIQDQILTPGAINHFTLRSTNPGLYYLQFQLSQTKTSDDGLTFGIGVNSLQPQLSYPYTFSSEMRPFCLQIVNPTDQATQLLLEAHNEFGELISEHQTTLEAHGKLESQVETLFPGSLANDIAWVQVQSNSPIVGTGTQIDADLKTGFAEPAFQGSFQELIIPHIAQLTEQWYTIAALTNSTAYAIQPELVTSANGYSMSAPENAFESYSFDFLDFFGGSVPDDGQWGRFVDNTAEKSLTGWEIFGKLDGNLQVAAISMIPARLKNPNFTYVRRDLYFPHIAADTASFWTGIAFVNTGEFEAVGNLKAFDSDGGLLAEQAIQLSPGAKRVDLVPAFFPSLDAQVPIAWLILETSDPFQGFELFGSNDGSNRRLAGFPAMNGAAKELHFLNIYTDLTVYWVGLAVVNVSEVSTSITYEGYNSSGEIVVSSVRNVAGLQKDVALLEDIFNNVPSDLAWIKVTADQPLAAFQLFGDREGNFMAGCLAQ